MDKTCTRKNLRKCHEICPLEIKQSKTKSGQKLNSTFSMIKFYESIPNYDEISHLPDYDFSQRLHLLKKVHCDLSKSPQKARINKRSSKSRCKRKKSAKKKSNAAIGICDSGNQHNCTVTEDVYSSKRSSTSTSQNSTNLCPTRQFPSIRDKLLAEIEEYDRAYDEKCANTKSSPFISPNMESETNAPFHSHHCRAITPITYPYENFAEELANFDCFHDRWYHRNTIKGPSICCSPSTAADNKEDENDSKPIEKLPSILRRSKSCPKDLFRASNYFPSEKLKNQRNTKCCDRQLLQGNINPDYLKQSTQKRCQSASKPVSRIKLPKAKTPDSIEEFLSAKIVRSNLAAKLRHDWSRKKIMEMTNQQLKPTTKITKFIPKCHQWNVRQSSAWKSFTLEDTTTEHFLRKEARREEQKFRQHAYTMNMNLMRARVKSANLLLEGRALSAK